MLDFIIQLIQSQNHFFVLAAGVMVGLIHAFEPDHISAMSTQIISGKSSITKKQSVIDFAKISSGDDKLILIEFMSCAFILFCLFFMLYFIQMLLLTLNHLIHVIIH